MITLETIQDRLKAPRHAGLIQRAIQLQQRHRFHSDTNLSVADTPAAATQFLEWVKGMLPKDKYNVFLHLFRFPVLSHDVVDTAFRELERVFESRNASANYRFTTPDLLEDWLDYKHTVLHEPEVWRTEGWEKLKTAFNNILVVDIAAKQASTRPEPYFYWLDIDSVVDYELKSDSCSFDWLMFNQAGHRLAVFDDTYYRVYQLNEKREIVASLIETPHNLGCCPARFFWSDPINSASPEIKKNPITKELSNLDWLLFFMVSKRHLDTYASYPIYSAYEHDCDFMNGETGDYCDGGFLRNERGEYKILADGSLEQCPVCSSHRLSGPGTFIEVPKPNNADGTPDMRKPVDITTIDTKSLDYNVKEEDRLKNYILTSVIGLGGRISENEAMNETQVTANFESKTAVLHSIKTKFELAQVFVEDTVCRLRYGSDYIGLSVSWGTEFYVFSAKELYSKMAEAKNSGASLAELNAIRQQIIEVEHKDNPTRLARIQLLQQLEPLPHISIDKAIELYEKGLISKEHALIKVHFDDLVQRFERENIDVLEFGRDLPMETKIYKILETFKRYISNYGNKI